MRAVAVRTVFPECSVRPFPRNGDSPMAGVERFLRLTRMTAVGRRATVSRAAQVDPLLPVVVASPTSAVQRVRHSRPQRELTVSATFRSSRRQRDRGADDRSQGSADVGRRMCVARWFPERQPNRCRGHWASKTNRMSAAHGAGLTHPTQKATVASRKADVQRTGKRPRGSEATTIASERSALATNPLERLVGRRVHPAPETLDPPQRAMRRLERQRLSPEDAAMRSNWSTAARSPRATSTSASWTAACALGEVTGTCGLQKLQRVLPSTRSATRRAGTAQYRPRRRESNLPTGLGPRDP